MIWTASPMVGFSLGFAGCGLLAAWMMRHQWGGTAPREPSNFARIWRDDPGTQTVDPSLCQCNASGRHIHAVFVFCHPSAASRRLGWWITAGLLPLRRWLRPTLGQGRPAIWHAPKLGLRHGPGHCRLCLGGIFARRRCGLFCLGLHCLGCQHRRGFDTSTGGLRTTIVHHRPAAGDKVLDFGL